MSVPVILFAASALLAAGVFLAARRAAGGGADKEIARLREENRALREAAAAREKAEAASLAKSRFLATVSHEIRTPLNGVMGLAQLLAMTRLDAEQASYVEAITASSRSLAQLIDDILDFSKIEAGKLELRRETFALAPLIESVLELLGPRAQEKGLEIAGFISPEAPRELVGDPARLRQILVNLIGNAINFTEKGGVGVRLEHDGAALRIEVRDTGPGVPETAREAIFEEFEQGDASATRRHGGAGLGLAISRRLSGLMGGVLTLAHSSAEGACFVFTLPAPPSAAAPPKPLQGQRVLIVAPSRFEAPFLRETFEAAGAMAERAVDEASAMDHIAAATPFDAIIVDCALGVASAARLASAARRSRARRVFLLFSPLERRAFGEAALGDFDGWLVKPVRGASLLARLVQEQEGPATARAAPPAGRLFDGLRVLIAEDNDVNALILTRHLEKLGARVTRARNGAEAVALAVAALGAPQSFELIIMDLFMPGLDGREATRQIRAVETKARASHTPILVLTASAREEDARAVKAAAADAFLTKPVELAELSAVIGRICRQPGAMESAK